MGFDEVWEHDDFKKTETDQKDRTGKDEYFR